MNMDQWYARKTSYGVSTTVHIIIRGTQSYEVTDDKTAPKLKEVVRLLCKPKGAYPPDGLVKVENFRQDRKQDDRCPECLVISGKRLKP